MKAASSALLSLLASRQFFTADLYLFSLIGGGQLRYCSGDADIVWNGYDWTAGGMTGPYFDRSGNKAQCHWKVGLEVDTLTVDVLPGSASVLGTPFLSAVRQGMFDGAEVTMYRAFMPTYGNVAAGTVIMFAGRVAEIDATRSVATFNISSHLELLNQNMPRNLYQAGCLNSLFDSACGLNRAAYAVSGTAASGSTSVLVNATLGQATGYFDMGVLAFAGGANSGISRTVKTYIHGSPGTISLIAPFPGAIAAGDSFTVYPGCDKQQGTCQNKFGNLARFRGFPYIPDISTAV